eukprot:gene11259-21450_t
MVNTWTIDNRRVQCSKRDLDKKGSRRSSQDPSISAKMHQLNLKKINIGIYICAGRLQDDYPVYLPTDAAYTERLVMNAHLNTLHGRVGLTITKIGERYWVPKLRQLTKRLIRSCFGFKQFHDMPLWKPPQASLPTERTTGDRLFQVIGSDNAGPLHYKRSEKRMAEPPGQFERMVGLVKQVLYKVVGKLTLTWEELADVLQDVELTITNRPLGYVEDDIQLPILTPNTMLFGQPNSVPDENVDEINDRDL